MATLWLDFQKEIVEKLINEDGLLILGKGLGIRKIIAQLLQVYCAPSYLVFIINHSMDSANYILDVLQQRGIDEDKLPKIITTKCSASERQQLYTMTGGVFFITSRILIVDLLNKRIDPKIITGFVICNAHSVTETSIEAFIIRVFRQANREGFVKAFSESVVSFLNGFSQLEHVLKHLYIQQVFFYPRFHDMISTYLETHQPTVYEIEQPLSTKMEHIQEALLVALDACLQELKKSSNNQLDTSELTVPNALLKSLDRSIRRQLDPIWHRISTKTKQLVSDLNAIRQLLSHFTRYDAISFYSLLNTHKTISGQQKQHQHSLWLYTEAADRLFKAAKSRIYSLDTTNKNVATGEQFTVNVHLEQNPKWTALREILLEIESDKTSPAEATIGGAEILIMAKDEHTCAQLRDYLYLGGERMMRIRFIQYLRQRIAAFASNARLNPEQEQLIRVYHQLRDDKATDLMSTTNAGTKPNTKRSKGKPKFGSSTLSSSVLASFEDDLVDVSQASVYGLTVEDLEKTRLKDESRDVQDLEKKRKTEQQDSGALSRNLVLCSYAQNRLFGSILDDLHPSFVILYDPDVQFIRELEVFNAEHPQKKVQIYFLAYEESAELQTYLSELSKEKNAFEQLIHQKSYMMIPRNAYDIGRQNNVLHEPPALSMDTRTGGRAKKVTTVPTKIICDVREFRSALPSMLHQSGLEVLPVTLEVGDFILTPQYCVERKGISDLFGSFKSGRLFNQAEQMARYYDTPILLIEFTNGKAFSLQNISDLGPEITQHNICSRMTLLVLHFPKLRLLWSKSPRMTVDLFKQLKHTKHEPDLDHAVRMGNSHPDDNSCHDETAMKYHNLTCHDMLLKLPGVTAHNVRKLTAHVHNLKELSAASKRDLMDWIGQANGKALHHFLTRKL